MRDYTDEFSFILNPSDYGIGVFAVHDIKAGTKLMLHDDGEVRVLKRENIPEEFHRFCIYVDDEHCNVPRMFNRMSIVWYLNHSDAPNAKANPDDDWYYATRDIRAGEEVLIDYNNLSEPEDLKEDYYRK